MVSTLALTAALHGFDIRKFDRNRVVAAAEAALASEPRSVMSAVNPSDSRGPVRGVEFLAPFLRRNTLARFPTLWLRQLH